MGLHAFLGQVRCLGGVLLAATLLTGCAVGVARNAVPLALVDKADVAGLDGIRGWGDVAPRDAAALPHARLPGMGRFAVAPTRESGRPIVNMLALSGGGADGAFGAGLLVGWSDAGTRPRFEVVTGVSAGALIAPFAFLGREHDRQLREMFTLYATEDLLRKQVVTGLFGGTALADSAPLAELIAKYVDQRMFRAIAREYRQGRMLLIGTTNLDAQRPVIWNMGEIAARGTPEALALFHKVVLASASIPGVFPPVHIEVVAGGHRFEEMHVDGGPTRQVFLVPTQLPLTDFDRFYEAPPLRRIYVIRNAKLGPAYEPAKATTIAIGGRTLSTLILNQSQGDLARIYQTASRANAEFNLAGIPPDFNEPSKEAFDRDYMQALFQRARALARSGYPWQKGAPKF